MKPSRLKRSRGLKPARAVRAYASKQDQKAEAERRGAWRQTTVRLGCAMCRLSLVDPDVRRDRGPDLKTLEAHHITPARYLKGWGHDELLWDPANGMCLCRYHHGRHETHMQRVPRHLVPDAAWAFAERLHMTWLLEREYPVAMS